MRKAQEAVLGDTLHLKDRPVTPLLDIEPARPMVFAGLYPFSGVEHKDLKVALHIALRIGRIGMVCTNGNRKKEQLPRGTRVKQGFFLYRSWTYFNC